LCDLKNLVERAYVTNGNTRVVLLSHSMGCLFTLKFLNTMSQAWKDKCVGWLWWWWWRRRRCLLLLAAAAAAAVAASCGFLRLPSAAC
jgi:hypothetical protein